MTDFKIKEVEDEVVLEKYLGDDSEVTIPENVTNINEKAFLAGYNAEH